MTPHSPDSDDSNHIDVREFTPSRQHDQHGQSRHLLSDDVSFMNEVAQEIVERDRRMMRRQVTRIASFVCAVLNW